MRLGRGSSAPAASGANLELCFAQTKRLFAACDLAESGWSPPLLCPRHLRSTPEPACPRGSPQAPPPGALASVGPAANAREDLGSSGSGSVAESGFAARPASISVTARERCPRRRPTRGHGPAGMRRPPAEAGGSAARPPAVPARPLFVLDAGPVAALTWSAGASGAACAAGGGSSSSSTSTGTWPATSCTGSTCAPCRALPAAEKAEEL